MTDALDVSVIIPAYNCEDFIGRALASAAAQTIAPLEILVVDDCSTDNTRRVVRAAAQADPRIRLLTMPQNGGPSVARNAGFAAAMGSWLAVLDADDAYAPARLERLVRFGKENEADIVADDLAYFDAAASCVTGRGIGDGAGTQIGPVSLRDYIGHNLATGRNFDWGLLKPVLRSQTLRRLGLSYDPALRHGEDFKLMIELLSAGARFHILNEALYLYTQRQGTVSGQQSGMTRTTIGYGKLKDGAMALMEEPAIRADPSLIALLRQRARGLARFDDAHFFSTAVRAGALPSLLARICRNPSFLPFMGRQLWLAGCRRLRRRGRPSSAKLR